MRGFLVGSLALIVVYVAVQPGTVKSAKSAQGVLMTALNHALAGDYAAIPDKSGAFRQFSKGLGTTKGTGTGTGSGSGSGSGSKTTGGHGPVLST